MRVTSHCANHPSREAEVKCRSCGTWLCDRCVEIRHGYPYCSLGCRIRDRAARLVAGALAFLRRPVPVVWSVIVVIVSLLVAGTLTGILVVRWLAERGKRPGSTVEPRAVAELVLDNGRPSIRIHGTPGSQAVLIADGQPLRIVSLDRQGRATVTGLGVEPGSDLAIASLTGSPEGIAPLPPPTLSPTPTGIPTAAPAPSRIPTHVRPTATPRIATPPATATHTPRPVESPREAVQKPPSTGVGSPPVLQLVTDAGPRIAITFDGNASSNGTAELLDLLNRLDLKITLFVTGQFVERYPTLVRRAVLAGHEVGSHTYSHPHLTTYVENRRHRTRSDVTRAGLHDQLRRTELAFRHATGRAMAPLWRAPYGEENATLRRWALELGYLHVRWSSVEGASLDSLDWIADEHSRLYRDSRRMIDRLLDFPRLEGGIVLMHLATEREEPPWTDLPRFVRELRKRQMVPVKISELLRASDTWRPWLERAERQHAETFGE